MEAQPIRILLVDDDASFLNSLEALLTGEPGLEIVGMAASGEEALAAAARAEPDVAVIDVLMPTMSGIECAQLLQERYPKARVILISGSIFEDKRPHPDERGTDAYLEKREVPERLHATILAPGNLALFQVGVRSALVWVRALVYEDRAADQDHARLRVALLQQVCTFDPAHRRHEHVDDGNVGFGTGGCRERLLAACCLADDLQPWFACEQGLERVQEGRIVIDEQNPDRLSFHRVCRP